MKQTYDELDLLNNIVVSNIKLVPGMKLKEGHKWVFHTPLLSTIKVLRKEYIDASRDFRCNEPISHLTYMWQADSRSQQLISTSIMLAMSANRPASTIWRTADNQNITISLQNLKDIANLIAARTEAAYAQSWSLKAQIEAALTPEAVNLIVWT